MTEESPPESLAGFLLASLPLPSDAEQSQILLFPALLGEEPTCVLKVVDVSEQAANR
jgi:hypothetical protein